MVTLGFLLIFISLGLLILSVDMFIYQFGFSEAFFDIIYSQGPAARNILIFYVILGLGWSIVTDIQRKKNRQEPNR